MPIHPFHPRPFIALAALALAASPLAAARYQISFTRSAGYETYHLMVSDLRGTVADPGRLHPDVLLPIEEGTNLRLGAQDPLERPRPLSRGVCLVVSDGKGLPLSAVLVRPGTGGLEGLCYYGGEAFLEFLGWLDANKAGIALQDAERKQDLDLQTLRGSLSGWLDPSAQEPTPPPVQPWTVAQLDERRQAILAQLTLSPSRDRGRSGRILGKRKSPATIGKTPVRKGGRPTPRTQSTTQPEARPSAPPSQEADIMAVSRETIAATTHAIRLLAHESAPPVRVVVISPEQGVLVRADLAEPKYIPILPGARTLLAFKCHPEPGQVFRAEVEAFIKSNGSKPVARFQILLGTEGAAMADPGAFAQFQSCLARIGSSIAWVEPEHLPEHGGQTPGLGLGLEPGAEDADSTPPADSSRSLYGPTLAPGRDTGL